MPRLYVCLIAALMTSAGTHAAGSLRVTRTVEIFRNVQGAVVNIHSERTVAPERPADPFGSGDAFDFPRQAQRVNGMGTGIVIDPRGYILTNHHVVEDVTLLRVRLGDGTSHPARVIARAPSEDLALLKIDPPAPLPTLAIGTSRDLIQGEPVIAIGNAYGYSHTLSNGIVSALNRDVTLNKEVSYKSLIQINASINPGNSGGPLLNAYGELIGVNVAIRAGAQGIAFAIPADTVVRVTTDLMSARRHAGLWHGLVVRNEVDTSENPVRRWLVVEGCEANSPALQCGLQPGDVLLKVGEFDVANSIDLERAVVERKPGDVVPVRVRRDGKEFQAELKLQAVNPQNTDAERLIWQKLGVKLKPSQADNVTRVNRQLQGGLAVVEVRPQSPANRGGLHPGDILIGLHRWNTTSSDGVTYVLAHPELANFMPLQFYIIRDGQVHQGWINTTD